MGDREKPANPFSDEPEDRDGRAGFVQEWIKKAAVAGLGALFMTEEGLRTLASQMKLPKEVLAFVLSSAEKTKDEVTRAITEEIRRFLQSEKLREEFVKLLTRATLEVTAKVRLIPEGEEEAGQGGKARFTVADVRVGRGARTKKE